MKVLLQAIITAMSHIWEKIQKLNSYWSEVKTLSISISNAGSNTISSPGASVRGNMMHIGINFKLATARSSGTSINSRLCTVTVTGLSNVCSNDTYLPRGEHVTLMGTGPICTVVTINNVRTDANTYTCDIYLGGVVGGALNTTDTYQVYFRIPIPRKITLS